jgi:hypothetical protein
MASLAEHLDGSRCPRTACRTQRRATASGCTGSPLLENRLASNDRLVSGHNRMVSGQPAINDLLDQAVRALNQGDRPTADALADQVLQVDRGNADAEELLAAPADSGELRRCGYSRPPE